MARIIPTSVCVYIVNPENPIFHQHHVPRMVKSLIDNIDQPHEIRKIYIRNIRKIKLVDLKPLTRSLNIVIIPDKKFFFDLRTHSDSTVLVVSVAAGNPKYCHGIYVQALTLIKKSLSGVVLETKLGSTYYRMKPPGKAILIASMVDTKDIKDFKKLYADACKLKLIRRHRNALLNIILLKKKLYSIQKERLNA